MGKLENEWLSSAMRRKALWSLVTAFTGGSALLRGQHDPYRDHTRIPARKELENVFRFRGRRVR